MDISACAVPILTILFLTTLSQVPKLNQSAVLNRRSTPLMPPFLTSTSLVSQSAPIRHLTAASLSSLCLTFSLSPSLALLSLPHCLSVCPSPCPGFLSWRGSCLFSAILGTCSARNKLLKWRPLACLLSHSVSLCLSLPLPIAGLCVYKVVCVCL